MENLEVPQREQQEMVPPPDKYEQKGRERLAKLKAFFSGIGQKLETGAVFALGAPERVVDAAEATWNTTTERLGRARDTFKTRLEAGKQKAAERLQALQEKAKFAGITVAAGVEKGIMKVPNELSAAQQEFQARWEGRRASRAEHRAERATAAYENKKQALLAQLEQLDKEFEEESTEHRAFYEVGKEKMYGYLYGAQEKRQRIGRWQQALNSLRQGTAA